MTEIASQLNWLDYLLLFILATSLIASLARGFVREIAGLVALLLAILLGMWFYGTAAAFFLPYVSAPQIADFLGFGLIFFAVVSIGGLAGFLVAKVVSVAGLSLFDRLLGGAFGLLKGALMGAIVVFALLAFTPKGPPEAVSRSMVAPYVTWTADVLAAIAPREVRDAVERNVTALRGIWENVPVSMPSLPDKDPKSGQPPTAMPRVTPQPQGAKPPPNRACLPESDASRLGDAC